MGEGEVPERTPSYVGGAMRPMISAMASKEGQHSAARIEAHIAGSEFSAAGRRNADHGSQEKGRPSASLPRGDRIGANHGLAEARAPL
jgi:hypothetical protein